LRNRTPLAGSAVRLVSNVASEAAFNDREWFSAHRGLQAPLLIWFDSKTIAGYRLMDSKRARNESMAKGNLMLTRQTNQKILIADGEIVITIKRIHGNRVTVLVQAEKDLEIVRGEIASEFAKRKSQEVAA
jgi:carbon storage regulator